MLLAIGIKLQDVGEVLGRASLEVATPPSDHGGPARAGVREGDAALA
jgi:hypothetical protein